VFHFHLVVLVFDDSWVVSKLLRSLSHYLVCSVCGVLNLQNLSPASTTRIYSRYLVLVPFHFRRRNSAYMPLGIDFLAVAVDVWTIVIALVYDSLYNTLDWTFLMEQQQRPDSSLD
jgi:hypothetical protein